MIIKTIEYNSAEYRMLCELRNEVLRRPINLLLTPEDIQKEANDMFIAALENRQIIGCCILTEINSNEVKLRQMAIASEFQKQKLGSRIMDFAEQLAKSKNYQSIYLHARKTAVEFYKKHGYSIISDEFLEVGIPHFEMRKSL